MDISKPVGSEIASVDFGVMLPSEIRRMSAKQITNPTVFDTLGHPVSGGLYDLALGAFLRNLCSSCGLDERFCPGHMGHIELPVPVYNPMFFNQMYLFLRSLCLYCHHFRLNKIEVHRYACRLRLLSYGLLVEADELDNLGSGNDDEEKVSTEQEDALREKREVFVEKAITAAISEGRTLVSGTFTSSVSDQRKRTVHEFYAKLLARPKCHNCGMYSPQYRKDGFAKVFETSLRDKQVANNRVKGLVRPDMVGKRAVPETSSATSGASSGSKYVLSGEIKNILNAVFAKEQIVIQRLFHLRPQLTAEVLADMFFLQAVVVPATRFRLPSKLGEEVHENSQNELLLAILRTALQIRDLNDQMAGGKEISGDQRRAVFNRLMNAFVALQNDVNGFIDATKNQNAPAGKVPTPGIKQALEKKEGLFRKHMMGKRVNFAARSVISPDPMLETNEIGVPPVFAVKLTYPEPVTAHNVAQLRQAVANGPEKWPGATAVQDEDGRKTELLGMSLEQRKAVANTLLTAPGKKVLRHLDNRDVVVMNRQPTLHKASMMGHRVRVLPGEKTLRLHYANTGAYNADFDGDEMNMHFPQNEQARAEAFNLAGTDTQYLTPTSGAPLRGLIQDHISAGVWLTSKDLFFTRAQYHQLVYGSVRPEDGHTTGARVRTVPPSILKPEPLWTGKQVITTVLMNITPRDVPGINLVLKNKIKNDYWGASSEENEVRFHNGHLVCGVLDKSQYGASQYGVVHSLHEVYGPTVAGKALSTLGRLFTNYTTGTAFTCGMDDLRLTAEGNKWRSDILKQATGAGRAAAAAATNVPEDGLAEDLRARLEEILRDEDKLGILDAVAQSKVNAITSQVVAKCVPDGTMKRFPYNSMQAMALSGAKGLAVNVSQIMCLLGQQALEGRRVPVMVSGKTLPSFAPYETDARAGGYIAGRFFSGIRPQEYYFHCMAGREGLIDTAVKTSRSGYLQRCLTKQLEGVHVAYDNSVRDADGTLVQFLYGGDAVDTTKQLHMEQFRFCVDNYSALVSRYHPGEAGDVIDGESAVSYAKKAKKALKKQAGVPHHAVRHKYDPVLLVFNPGKHLGAVSEAFQDRLDAFVEANSGLFLKQTVLEKRFRALMHLKYMRLLIQPGEAVGIVASQSVGEPSTQMTLNTFHFAGHGAANVTLGIPRMREIIMTASAAIKTPTMTLPLRSDVLDDVADAFCKSVGRVSLAEFVDRVSVTETTGFDQGSGFRSYTMRLDFYPQEEYSEEYDVGTKQLEFAVIRRFLAQLEGAIQKELRKQKSSFQVIGKAAKPVSEVSGRPVEEDDGDEDKPLKQAVSYDGPDDDEVDAMVLAEASEASEDEDLEMSLGSESDSESESELEAVVKKEPKALLAAARDRQAEVCSQYQTIKKFSFDDDKGQWCEFQLELLGNTEKLLMVNIVEEVCRSTVVREVPRIKRCVRPQPDAGGARILTTEGVNFKAMWEQDDFIDVDGVTSNEVHAVLKTYGVEAARQTIVNEINNVFDRYAILVLRRHLDLIGDMMTREGSYLAFNRQGMELATSLFMKMSYETTCQFLTKAVLDGEREALESPSARIVVGKLLKVGTGLFDVLTKMPAV